MVNCSVKKKKSPISTSKIIFLMNVMKFIPQQCTRNTSYLIYIGKLYLNIAGYWFNLF